MSMMNQIMYCLRKQPQVTTTDNFMNYCYMDYEKHFIKVLCSHANPEVLLSMYPGLPGIDGEHSQKNPGNLCMFGNGR